MLRLAATLATIVGLAAFGLALGDFASHPNPLGAIGLIVFFFLGGAAIWQLNKPRDRVRPEPVAEVPEPAEAKARRRPSQRPTSASLFDDDV